MCECKFDKAWIGYCKKETVEGENYCAEHINTKCAICGEQATHECAETFQFVCGTPLCDKESCRIKHHPKFYNFTPRQWGEIYGMSVTKEMFGFDWGIEISNEKFKAVVTKPIKEIIAKAISEQLNKSEVFESDSFRDMVMGKYEGKFFKLEIETKF